MTEPVPKCISDFGDVVYQCWHTGVLVGPDDVQFVGAIVPGVRSLHPMAKTEKARAARKQSGIWFHESERNCNTCKYLERVPHEKSKAGFLYGRCTSEVSQQECSPYASRQEGDVMIFHPDDPMHMPCYESRWKERG